VLLSIGRTPRNPHFREVGRSLTFIELRLSMALETMTGKDRDRRRPASVLTPGCFSNLRLCLKLHFFYQAGTSFSYTRHCLGTSWHLRPACRLDKLLLLPASLG
jgi:hypothetical protein